MNPSPRPRHAARALLLGSVLAGLLAGCQSPPPARPSTGGIAMPAGSGPNADAALTPRIPAPAYTLQPGDELDLRFADHPQLDRSLKVQPDGLVTAPLVGSLNALGRTPEALQAELLARYQALAPQADERQYLIRPGDELEVKFAYLPQFNEVVKVRPDGRITVQLAGTVMAQGLSPEALQAALAQRYRRVLRQPELVVIMRSFTSQALTVVQDGRRRETRAGAEDLRPVLALRQSGPTQVFVGGEVLRPGVLAWRPGLTVMQALMEVGGQLPSARLTGVLVLRRRDGQSPEVLRLDLRADLDGTGSQDIALAPTDVVVLPALGVTTLARTLDQYVFNLLPPLRNSSFGFAYDLRGQRD
ncbi:polysaccharide export outer membrane protein [Sphaerotilus hippei]|uniref:Polysaccharide export outer membrane protein n=1 Tax=Sphaerotilus hippei TaxID=744406 RepID=A0A318H0E7_9BURK|nr:polysaccharide biosynthesis/export family protein [Sphaerotilus hippei]PXW96201.1 polysaccharide export outer membrane protein [Sphaerotilus hippei]